MRFGGKNRRESHSTMKIYYLRDRLQVVRVDAQLVPAEMVELEPGRDLVYQELIGPPVRLEVARATMCPNFLSCATYAPIATSYATSPFPALAGRFGLLPKECLHWALLR